MSLKTIISLDVMGGDFGPEVVIAGAKKALETNPNICLHLFGCEKKIKNAIDKYPSLIPNIHIIGSSDEITMEDKPSKILRNSQRTSMGMAIESVKNKESSAIISCGNTGALMALSKIKLKTIDGIKRPALITIIPNEKSSYTVMLDIGANIKATSQQLLEYSVMGSAFSKIFFNKDLPKVALLNIGSEEIKGDKEIQTAYNMLSSHKYPFDFFGYIEGNDILTSHADVVVTNGFVGNVALKSLEGASLFTKNTIKKMFMNNWLGKLCYLMFFPYLSKISKNINPSSFNGAFLLGLNGIVMKSHGNSNEEALAQSILTCSKFVQRNLNAKIIETIDLINQINDEQEC